ncbi:phospholipase D-like domain-containing protein [Neofamilia massiliensis]|uniref:phospholipase D-like domain-containing protein n=1 Tax=Neofamilia massiliensis TaxID=1673724 RepID=UPI0006BB729F|nr:phospholipase D-like domain-containing protein [Neofamilia massiliensis]
MKIKIRYIIILLLLVPFIYSLFTKNYKNSNLDGEFYPAKNVDFLHDLTYMKDGQLVKDQSIFKEQIKLIANAKEFIILDLFLYNDEYDRSKMDFANQVEEMTEALIKKHKEDPSLDIVFITDELNNFYGSYKQKHLKRLETEGIKVNLVNLNTIRDSNPLYSGLYRFYIKHFGQSDKGFIKNIFDPQGPKLSIRSFLRLLNFKANHRKVLITEEAALVSSSNPHDPSSKHSNVAVKFYGKAMEDLIKSELGLVADKYENIQAFKAEEVLDKNIKIRAISEKKIFDALEENILKAEEGDQINIGIFYIADRKLLKSLADASKRGVEIRIIADLNKDAFGLEKNGAPNRPALSQLVDENPEIQVRWYQTHGEQFHTKMAIFSYKDKDPRIILGSANFTRRNLQNYNLETDLELSLSKDSDLYKEVESYYEKIWTNQDGNYTVPLEDYYEDGKFLRLLWKIQEFTGLCTW